MVLWSLRSRLTALTLLTAANTFWMVDLERSHQNWSSQERWRRTLCNSDSNGRWIHLMMNLVGLMKHLLKNLMKHAPYILSVLIFKTTLDLTTFTNPSHLLLTTVLVPAHMMKFQLYITITTFLVQTAPLHQFDLTVSHVPIVV